MFDVDLSTPEFAGHGVVALSGELDLANAQAVASHLITAVAAYGPWVIVDLAGLEHIDSAGLGVLVRALKWTRCNGGDLPLAAPQGVVRDVLTATGLIDVFSVYPSVEHAMRGANPSAEPGRVVAAPGTGRPGFVVGRLPPPPWDTTVWSAAVWGVAVWDTAQRAHRHIAPLS